MKLRGCDVLRRVFLLIGIFLLIVPCVLPAAADSFANLNVFGYPALPGDDALSGLSGTSPSSGSITASAASISPSNWFDGTWGSGFCGLGSSVSFGYPTASHDTANVAYANNKAFEATTANDAIAFPNINACLGTSSFPTIATSNADVKSAESTQLLLTTESDTMPITGYSYPFSLAGFFR